MTCQKEKYLNASIAKVTKKAHHLSFRVRDVKYVRQQ